MNIETGFVSESESESSRGGGGGGGVNDTWRTRGNSSVHRTHGRDISMVEV